MVRKGSSVRVRQRASGDLQVKRSGAPVKNPRVAQRGRNVRPHLPPLRAVVRWAGPTWAGRAKGRSGASETGARKSWPTSLRVPGGSVAVTPGVGPSDRLWHGRDRDSNSTRTSQALAVLKTATGSCPGSWISRDSSIRPAPASKSTRISRRFAGRSRLRGDSTVACDRQCWRRIRSSRPRLSRVDVARWPRRPGAARPRAPP